MKTRIATALLLVFFSGCSVLKPAIPGTGIIQSENRQVDFFDKVHLAGFGNVNVYSGDSPSVCITTDENLLAHVDTWVENGRLKIKPRTKIRPKSGLTIDITAPQLTAAHISGAGDLNIVDHSGDYLELSISGAGTLKANGFVNDINASISGAGDVHLKDLAANNVNVRISGSGNAYVFANESIEAKVSGAGDVVCYGNPTHVNQTISGAGNFTMRDAPPLGNYAFGGNASARR